MKPMQLLLVDDNRQDIILFRAILKKASALLGHEIQCDSVMNGKEAIDAVASKHYHVVFLDQQMPDPDGLQTFATLRHFCHLEAEPTHVVLYSNCDLDEFRRVCLQAGLNDFAAKYLDAEGLVALLRKHCPALKSTV